MSGHLDGEPTAPSSGTAPAPVRGGAQIALAMAVMNIATYGFTMLAARLLGPERYGGFAAVMNLLLVISVAALALQATAARRISAEQEHVAQIERVVRRVTWRAALGIGLVLLALSPVLAELLRLDDLATAALVGLTAVPLTAMGGMAGVLQGERRWGVLGVLYLTAGLPRLVIGVALLAWRPTEFVAVLAVAISTVAPVLVGWWALRTERSPAPAAADADRHGARSILTESLSNAQTLLAFFALSNLDIVVARNVLSGHESGLYAAGLILTKAMLFLPQFVVVVAFPSMATTARRTSALARGLGLIAAIGLLGTLGCLLLPQVALVFVGGGEFSPLADTLWVFSLLGTALAVLQLLVYSVLARQGRRSSLLVWAGLAAMLLTGSGADSLTSLVTRVLVVDAVLVAVLLALSGLPGLGSRSARSTGTGGQ